MTKEQRPTYGVRLADELESLGNKKTPYMLPTFLDVVLCAYAMCRETLGFLLPKHGIEPVCEITVLGQGCAEMGSRPRAYSALAKPWAIPKPGAGG